MIWSDAAVQRLEQLRAEGLSWVDVARRLTREFGSRCTAQAAEGKLARHRKAQGKSKHRRFDWWDQDRRTQRLIERWNALGGETGTARMIADELGCSRNAVLGKAKRLRDAGVHLVAKTNGHNGTTRKSTKRKRKPKRPREQNAVDAGHAIRAANARQRAREAATAPKGDEPASMPSERTESIPGVPFIEARNGHCRWPLWDGPDDPRHVCGERRKAGSSYCPEHAERARNRYCPAPADAA